MSAIISLLEEANILIHTPYLDKFKIPEILKLNKLESQNT